MPKKAKSWESHSVAAIAKALFKQHDWDFDRAVASAYWAKHGRMINHDYWRYCTQAETLAVLPTISVEDADKLLTDYNLFKRGLL